MTLLELGRSDQPVAAPAPPFAPATVAKWLMGLRLVAVSALFVGVLLVQTTTEEILPIAPLTWVTALTYGLSLLWLTLWLAGVPPGLHGGLQLGGDLVIASCLVYFTGGLTSPFPFLFLIPVGVAALMFGLRGSLTTAGAAFVAYSSLAEAQLYGLISVPAFFGHPPPLHASALAFQIMLNGAGFALVALLTSYLGHSLQQAEARLRGEQESTARFQALYADVVRSVDSGVIASDLEGRVVLANPAAIRMLQAQAPLEGRLLSQLLPLEEVQWSEMLQQSGKQVPLRVEGTLVGSQIPLGCTVTPLQGSDGTPLGFVVHFRDLTEAREAARRDRLRERMVAIGEMAAGIAHEIRNPLASISGSAQVLGKLPALAENERRLLRIIVEESRRLSGIIESFLGYARPPAPRRAQCRIWQTLEETLSLFRNSPEVTAGHHIVSDIHPCPAPIVADEEQLRQAFFNLARNAMQAMPAGGTMTVVARPDETHYVISWSDEGVGMRPEQIQEIFHPFKAFRTGGMGLGLSFVYSIVSDHGGEIEVHSEPDRGSTFVLRIPLGVA